MAQAKAVGVKVTLCDTNYGPGDTDTVALRDRVNDAVTATHSDDGACRSAQDLSSRSVATYRHRQGDGLVAS